MTAAIALRKQGPFGLRRLRGRKRRTSRRMGYAIARFDQVEGVTDAERDRA